MMSIMTIASRNAIKTMTSTAATGNTGDASSDGPGSTGWEELSPPSVTMSWGPELEVGSESTGKVVCRGRYV